LGCQTQRQSLSAHQAAKPQYYGIHFSKTIVTALLVADLSALLAKKNV